MKLLTQAVGAALVVGAAAGGGTAFTAANTTTPVTSVVQASSITTGFAVSAVDYSFAAVGATGNQIATVAFTLTAAAGSPAATTARIRLISNGTYFDCAPGTTTGLVTAFTCAITAVDASAANLLDIAATSN